MIELEAEVRLHARHERAFLNHDALTQVIRRHVRGRHLHSQRVGVQRRIRASGSARATAIARCPSRVPRVERARNLRRA